MTNSLCRGRDPLGRYYTPGISQVFVSLLDRRHANSILDLGSGGGSLTVAAAQRWTDASTDGGLGFRR
ncbi:hypothetical protein EJ071_38070 [Mesorhizobium sp. M1B.F.Ca.ET.045.04.1.1]|nr:hypothetical protein EJ071_38070 [Mesorhizobium sp. M1B.F.Ca.ET.045.04.1.1]